MAIPPPISSGVPTGVYTFLTRFYSLNKSLAEKKHNLQADRIKVAFSNSEPALTAATLSDITEISYTGCGSRNVDTSDSISTTGVYSLILSDATISATGDVGPFQYVVLYNANSLNDDLLGYYDYGSGLLLKDGENLFIDFDGLRGAISVEPSPAYFLRDNFNRPNSSGLGGGWTQSVGSWEIFSSGLRATSGSNKRCIVETVQEFDINHYAQATHIINEASSTYFGPIVRVSGENGYIGSWADGSGPVANRNRWTIWRMNTFTSFTEVVKETGTSSEPLEGTSIKLTAYGDNISLYVDDTSGVYSPVLSGSDSTHRGKRAGFIVDIATAGADRYGILDDFEAG